MNEEAFRKAFEEGKRRRQGVGATYRLQLNSKFTFDDAVRILPYLKQLGITHIYASPYLKARVGSSHGYDVIDHSVINPEIGGREGFELFAAALKDLGMGHIADVVPNHVGISGNCNAWWNDVLEYGRYSRYADFFDITWDNPLHPANNGKVLLPILGETYGEALRNKEIELKAGEKELYFSCCSSRLPLSVQSLEFLLPELMKREMQTLFVKLNSCSEATERYREVSAEIKEAIARRLWKSEARQLIENELSGINGDIKRLDKLIRLQHWRIAWWKTASDEINYRRFFDINELAALKVEKPAVFEATHALILELLSQGKIDGLRIDHPDGLLDPGQYCRRLQARFIQALSGAASSAEADEFSAGIEPPLYVVVEKILGHGEELDQRWSCHGTSGYDFLTMTNAFFIDAGREEAMEKVWAKYSDGKTAKETIREAKRFILRGAFAGQFETLTFDLFKLAQSSIDSCDLSLGMLRAALEELIVCFPVYRTYLTRDSTAQRDIDVIQSALRESQGSRRDVPPIVFAFIGKVLIAPERLEGVDVSHCRRFAGKLQQLTAPVTAKGVEDTACYRFLRLLSVNEVGGDITGYGVSPSEFHTYLQKRAQSCPYALSPLSTHDTKRSEDVRARLNVLSEIPQEWETALEQLEKAASSLEEFRDIHPSDRYLIFQSLVGAWPPGCSRADSQFKERFTGYVLKAVREAKLRTSWNSPDEMAESRILKFTERLLEADRFYSVFLPFQQKISWYGLLNSLSQTVIRLTAPGIPDTYQGQELWDFSLVDPDNRRAVDYGERERLLAQTEGPLPRNINLHDPRTKLQVTAQLLRLRNRWPELLREGSYTPLKVKGERESHIFSFLRRSKDVSACVIVGRFFTELCLPGELPAGEKAWKSSRIILPGSVPDSFQDVLSGTQIRSREGGISIPDVFNSLPAAVLLSGL